MEDDTELPNRKRRKLDSQAKGPSNSSDFAEVSGATIVFSGDVKVEEVQRSSTHADARSREQGASWPDSLSEAQLDLLVSIKELAMERLMSIGETCLEEVLPASALQTIGMIMEELVKHHVKGWALPTVIESQPIRTSQDEFMPESGDDSPSTTRHFCGNGK